MLLAKKLGKRYGARVVFRDVNFEVASGTVAAVIGANGAGKSTLLKIIAGLARASAGTLEWQAAPGQALQWQCGLFAPDAPVYRELTAYENLEFFARARGLTFSREELLAQLAKFDLGARHRDLAMDLSSGLRARLQLAVATLAGAPLLLLDEPSANLDAAGRALLQRALEAQRGHGLALVATNDPRDLELCEARISL